MKQNIFQITFFALLLSGSLIFSNCGAGTDFTGQTSAQPLPTIPLSPELPAQDPFPDLKMPPPGHPTLTWLWDCKGLKENVLEKEDVDQFMAYGKGDYQVPIGKNNDLSLIFQGTFCPTERLKRDIIFIVDVTGSMTLPDNHDPMVNNDCGRANAVKKALDSFPDNGEVHFAAITFSDEVVKKSTTFHQTENDFFSDNLSYEDLCSALGGTNYDAPLQEAENLFQTGREDATKEIYLISDGEPNEGDGKDLAKKLKEIGVKVGNSTIPVTIATIMLQGNDQVMKDSIASHDQDDQPLHAKVENAQDLEVMLSKLAFNKVMRGEIKYRPINSKKDFVVIRLERTGDQADFSVAPVDISLQKTAPEGLEVFYTYWDRLTHEYKNQGFLHWSL